jgi:hypothetical protein
MAIVVKHSGNAAPVLYGAYGSGQGKRRAEDSRQAMDIVARANEASRQRAFAYLQSVRDFKQRRMLEDERRKFEDAKRKEDFAFRAEQAGKDREWRSNEADLHRQWQDEQFLNRADYKHELRLAEQKDAQWRQEDLAISEQERRRDDIEWNYTTKQRQDYNRMFDLLEAAREDRIFTDDEFEEVKQQAYKKLLGLEPVPVIKKRSPFPEGQQPGQTWESADGNFLLTRDDKGNIKKLGELNQRPSFQDRNAAFKLAMEMAQEEVLDSKGKGTGEFRTNPKKVKKLVQEILGTQDYGGADPVAVQRYGVGYDDDEEDAEVDDSTDKNKKPSPADRWAI